MTRGGRGGQQTVVTADRERLRRCYADLLGATGTRRHPDGNPVDLTQDL